MPSARIVPISFFEALGWLGISKTHWHTMMPDLRKVMFNFGGGRCASMICMPWGDLLEAWGDSWMTVCHAEGGDLMLGGVRKVTLVLPPSFVERHFLRHRQTAVPRAHVLVVFMDNSPKFCCHELSSAQTDSSA